MWEVDPVLRSISDLVGCGIVATDGEIGAVRDVYFDDERWVMRYLILDSGGRFSGRRVLISPMAFEDADWDERKIHLNLTKEQIERSPGIEQGEPVSRQIEERIFAYYGWPSYRQGSGLWGPAHYPGAGPESYFAPPNQMSRLATADTPAPGDPHLRSANEVMGYTVSATDGSVGTLEDLMADDHSWEIRWIVANTQPWWLGGDALIPSKSVSRISQDDKAAYVDLTRDRIASIHTRQGDQPITREYERRLAGHYFRDRKAA